MSPKVKGYRFTFEHHLDVDAENEALAWEEFWTQFPDADPNGVDVEILEDDDWDNTIVGEDGSC